MNSTPLLIDDDVRAEIAKVVAYAEANRINVDQLAKLAEDRSISIGDDPRRSLVIPFGFRCVFSIEEQKFGWTRHLSVSVVRTPAGSPVLAAAGGADCTVRHKAGRAPNQYAMRLLMDEFGMKKPLQNCYVYLDEVEVNGAVNVIEPMGEIHETRGTAGASEEPSPDVG